MLYRIDARDVLVETGGGWDQFAAANGGLGRPVLGRPLWHFVSGEDVRGVWSLLLRHVRREQRHLAFLYRCDAPGIRRLMQMELLAEDDGSVAFRSRAVRMTAAPTVVGRWEAGPHRPTVAVCGWCGRIHADGWITPDEAIELLGLGDDTKPPRLTHGICETCARELRALART